MAEISKDILEMSNQPWFSKMMSELGYEKIRYGRWLPSDKGDCTYTCSKCGFVRDAYILEEKAYCPRCGADMRGGENGRLN